MHHLGQDVPPDGIRSEMEVPATVGIVGPGLRILHEPDPLPDLVAKLLARVHDHDLRVPTRRLDVGDDRDGRVRGRGRLRRIALVDSGPVDLEVGGELEEPGDIRVRHARRDERRLHRPVARRHELDEIRPLVGADGEPLDPRGDVEHHGTDEEGDAVVDLLLRDHQVGVRDGGGRATRVEDRFRLGRRPRDHGVDVVHRPVPLATDESLGRHDRLDPAIGTDDAGEQEENRGNHELRRHPADGNQPEETEQDRGRDREGDGPGQPGRGEDLRIAVGDEVLHERDQHHHRTRHRREGAHQSEPPLSRRSQRKQQQDRDEHPADQKQDVGRGEGLEQRRPGTEDLAVLAPLDGPDREPVGEHRREDREESDEADPEKAELRATTFHDAAPGIGPEGLRLRRTDPPHHVDAADRLFGILLRGSHRVGRFRINRR